MEALADKVHKQGEHIPQYCYISHNHPCISSSDKLGGTISTVTYIGMVVHVKCEMQQCCGMCSPCLCILSASASIYPPIPTFGRFLLEIVLNFLSLFFFVMWCAHALAVDASSANVHQQMASNS